MKPLWHDLYDFATPLDYFVLCVLMVACIIYFALGGSWKFLAVLFGALAVIVVAMFVYYES